MLANRETLQNLILSVRDLTHRVALKFVAEMRFARDALLASKLGKKASTNLEATPCRSTDITAGEQRRGAAPRPIAGRLDPGETIWLNHTYWLLRILIF